MKRSLLPALLLLAAAPSLHAQAVVSPSIQGTSGSSAMGAGSQRMMFSAPQVSAAVMTSGPHALHSGFFGFLAGLTMLSAPPGQGMTLTIMTAAGLATVYLPAYSVPAGSAVSLALPAFVPPGGGGGFTALLDSAFQIDSSYALTLPTTLSLSYANADFAGKVPAQLIVARYDAARAVWVPLLSAVDASNEVVRAQAGESTLFQLMQLAPAGSVAGARAFPNPLRFSQGHTAMTFMQLPADAKIRIYTLKGVLVKVLTANASGMASWDGTNQAGAPAQTQAYFVSAQGGSGKPRTLSVAIER